MSAWVFVLGITFSMVVVSGCEEEVPPAGPDCTASVVTNAIITNPLAPAPGDTTLLTIQATGEGCGNWAAYRWTVSGGELIQDTGITVTWVAPSEYGSYSIRCIASLTDARPDTSNALIMIRDFEYIDTGTIVSLWPVFLSSGLYFAAEDGDVGPRSNEFQGYSIYKIASTGRVTEITVTDDPSDSGAFEFDYASSGDAILGAFVSAYYSGLRQQRMNVWKFPTLFGDPVDASSDPGGLGILRKNQHRYPKTNRFATKAVWKLQFAGEAGDGTQDLFNICYWDEMDGAGGWYTVTTSLDSAVVIAGPDTVTEYRYFNNIKPMFTPSEDNILYFVDTTGVFEPCLIPMIDGAPDTLQRRALMVDEYVGIFEEAGVYIGENTVFEWNPASPVLSFISVGNIILFDYQSEIVSAVSGLESVTEFTWAPDGSQIVAVNDQGIFLVSSGGAVNPNPIFQRELSTDDIFGINWNNDITNPQVSFRLVRKGKSDIDSWSALIVIDLNSGLWAYASTTVAWHSSRESADIPYTWKRVIFTDDDMGIYAPFPVLDEVNYPGKDVILIYSHE